ncbi:MAG: hypothetical protein HYX97_03230 [Chloroflexi bacterium]|nr:hypothetical protein [Chloroflexota bacterium]
MDDLSKKFAIGLALTLALIIILPVYAAFEPDRHDKATERFLNEEIERGAKTYVSACVVCHGPKGGGKLEGPQYIGFPLNPEYRLQAGLTMDLTDGSVSGIIDEDTARKVIERGRLGGDLTGELKKTYPKTDIAKLTIPGVNMPLWGESEGGPIKSPAVLDLVTLLIHWDQHAVDQAAGTH